MTTIALVGSGNLGGALATRLVSAKLCRPEDLIAVSRTPEKLARLQAELGIRTETDPAAAVAAADFILLCVKPKDLPELGPKLAALLGDKPVVSLLAGTPIQRLEQFLGPAKIIRAMTNTSVLIGEGMTALCRHPRTGDGEFAEANQIFAGCGKVVCLEEAQFDAFTAIAGSLPAYLYLFIEHLIAASVLEGFSADKATEYVSQSCFGAIGMLQHSGKDPATLWQQVCSPGGTTIEAIKVFEDRNLRGIAIQAVHACADKSRHLSGK